MSTKVPDGYRLAHPDGSRPDVFDVVTAARTALQPAYRATYTRRLVRAACHLIDAVGHRPSAVAVPNPLAAADADLHEAAKEIAATGYRNPEVDFSAELTLLSDVDGGLYCRLHVEQDAYVQAFEALPFVHPYFFWNGTDAPDDLSDQEWREREATWLRLLPRVGPVPVPPVRWELYTPGRALTARHLTDDELAAAIPDRPARARRVARDLVPVGEVVDGGFELRDPEDISADRGRVAAGIEPHLADLTVTDLRPPR